MPTRSRAKAWRDRAGWSCSVSSVEANGLMLATNRDAGFRHGSKQKRRRQRRFLDRREKFKRGYWAASVLSTRSKDRPESTQPSLSPRVRRSWLRSVTAQVIGKLAEPSRPSALVNMSSVSVSS